MSQIETKSRKLALFRVLTYAEPGYSLLKKDKYAQVGIYRRKTAMEYFMLWNILRTKINFDDKSDWAHYDNWFDHKNYQCHEWLYRIICYVSFKLHIILANSFQTH